MAEEMLLYEEDSALINAPIHFWVYLIKVGRLCHGMPIRHGEVCSGDVGGACKARQAQLLLGDAGP
jgi:hypothetical protein